MTEKFNSIIEASPTAPPRSQVADEVLLEVMRGVARDMQQTQGVEMNDAAHWASSTPIRPTVYLPETHAEVIAMPAGGQLW